MFRHYPLKRHSAHQTHFVEDSVSSFSHKMPVSLRRQRRQEAKRKTRDEELKKAQLAVAVEIISGKTTSIRKLSNITGLPKSTINDIKQKIARNNDCGLRSLISPKKRAGAQRVLSDEEEVMIVSHLQWSARRGFAVDNIELKSIMGQIANDGRERSFTNGVPSDETLRSFRARHPELRFRKAENKEAVKLKGEDYLHVKAYEDALCQVKSEFPKIFDDPDCVWNMDETNVDSEFGERKKVCGNADTHHGGFSTVTAGKGDGRHVTVVVACSASGKKAPPFFIIQDRRNMSNWYLGLDEDKYKFKDTSLNIMLREGWFPTDACVVMTEKGSMDKATIPIFMKHLDRFVRQHVSSQNEYLLVLDGHSSRKGVDWLEVARDRKCEVVQSPANTSHFLQPCDFYVNKKFGTTVRKIRDAFCLASSGKTDTRTIQAKLMFGLLGLEAITASDIRKSWEETGLWPMNYRFVEKWKTRKHEIREKQAQLRSRMASAGPGTALASVQRRHSDKDTFNMLAAIVEEGKRAGGIGASAAIQKVAICLDTRETVNSVLMAKAKAFSSTSSTRLSENNALATQKTKNVALSGGAPAEYLTHGDVLRKRKQKEAEEAALEAAKLERKRKRSEERRMKEIVKCTLGKRRTESGAHRKAVDEVGQKKQRRRKAVSDSDKTESKEPEVVNALLSLRGT